MKTNKLLLDTHVFLWWLADDARLTAPARRAIAEADVVFVSAASAWEIAIKVALGRLRIPAPVSEGVARAGFERLPVDFAHAELAGALPPHHRDPFDRMLIAQAVVEDLVLVSADQRMAEYDVKLLGA